MMKANIDKNLVLKIMNYMNDSRFYANEIVSEITIPLNKLKRSHYDEIYK
jgi:hypothetical protein